MSTAAATGTAPRSFKEVWLIAAGHGLTHWYTATFYLLLPLIGKELGPTEWFEVTQERIDQFAEATDDPQWIHTDPARAAEGPFGTTVAHGFLTLSLCVPLMTQTLRLTGYSMGVNYGVNKVRFPHPVRVGSQVRAHVTLQSVEEAKGALQLINVITIEIEGVNKPGCVAEMVSLLYF